MSADSYEELKIRLEFLLSEIQGIKYDSYGCSRFEELRPLIEEAKEELNSL